MAIHNITGTNCWTIAEDRMVSIMSECASAQAFLGAFDAADAKCGNMFLDSTDRAPEEYTDSEWADLFPNIIIGTPGATPESFVLTGRSTGADFGASGLIEVVFGMLADKEDSVSQQERKFKNHVGDILEELTGKIAFDKRSLAVQAYGRGEEVSHEELGVVLSAVIEIPWGVIQDEQ